MSNSPAPTMHTLPICRLTRAACDDTPPTAVRMPSAAFMPRRSSGVVSLRTRISAAFGLACFSASAFCGVNTILPVAAPGPAGMPLVSSLPALLAAFLASASNSGCNSWLRSPAGMNFDEIASSLRDQTFLRPCRTATRTAAKPVRLALRVWSM